MSDFMFENREPTDSDPLVVGGMSVSTLLQKSKRVLDVDGALFTRFTNLVVPLGLQRSTYIEQEDASESEIGQLIDSKKFDQLFYSVGKDLGVSSSRTVKNRTMKNPMK